jgi:hypothetical protein
MTVPTATSFVHPSPLSDPGEGERGRPLVSIFARGEALIFLEAHGGHVADPMIEANLTMPQSLASRSGVRKSVSRAEETLRFLAGFCQVV